jgi:hypothetical protein
MIIRAAHKVKYTVIVNSALEDKKLSYKARGILASLLAKPDTWIATASQLAGQSPDGLDGVRSGLKELEQHGYLATQRGRSNGKFTWSTTIYETPLDGSPPKDSESAVFNGGESQPGNLAQPKAHEGSSNLGSPSGEPPGTVYPSVDIPGAVAPTAEEPEQAGPLQVDPSVTSIHLTNNHSIGNHRAITLESNTMEEEEDEPSNSIQEVSRSRSQEIRDKVIEAIKLDDRMYPRYSHTEKMLFNSNIPLGSSARANLRHELESLLALVGIGVCQPSAMENWAIRDRIISSDDRFGTLIAEVEGFLDCQQAAGSRHGVSVNA